MESSPVRLAARWKGSRVCRFSSFVKLSASPRRPGRSHERRSRAQTRFFSQRRRAELCRLVDWVHAFWAMIAPDRFRPGCARPIGTSAVKVGTRRQSTTIEKRTSARRRRASSNCLSINGFEPVFDRRSKSQSAGLSIGRPITTRPCAAALMSQFCVRWRQPFSDLGVLEVSRRDGKGDPPDSPQVRSESLVGFKCQI